MAIIKKGGYEPPLPASNPIPPSQRKPVPEQPDRYRPREPDVNSLPVRIDLHFDDGTTWARDIRFSSDIFRGARPGSRERLMIRDALWRFFDEIMDGMESHHAKVWGETNSAGEERLTGVVMRARVLERGRPYSGELTRDEYNEFWDRMVERLPTCDALPSPSVWPPTNRNPDGELTKLRDRSLHAWDAASGEWVCVVESGGLPEEWCR